MSGLLINLEGIDGSGKNTCYTFIKEYFEKKNFEVKNYHYPDENSVWGKAILMFLEGKSVLSTEEQFFAYFVDMVKDQKNIENDLKQGKIVVLDRYVPSTLAFQCAKGFDLAAGLKIISSMNILIPNLTILLDIDPIISQKRKKMQKMLDKHEEDLKLQMKVRDQYNSLLKLNVFSNKWVLIDSNKEVNNLKKEIINNMDSLIKQKDNVSTMQNKKPDGCYKDYLTTCEPAFCIFRLSGECKEYKKQNK
jgi:dTMP kinase